MPLSWKTAKVYGTAKRKEVHTHKIKTHTRRVWKTRKDGFKQRYHKKITTYKQKRTRIVKKYVEKKVTAKTGKELKEKIVEAWKEEEWVEYEVHTP